MATHLFTRVLLLFVAAIAGTGAAAQSSYPDRPVRLVIGFPSGSVTDLASRILAHKMSELLGQPVVVDNRPGASTSIAAVVVAKSAPDGYTLFMAGNSNAVTPSLQKNVPFDFFRDFAPVALAVSVPNILVVNPALGVSDVPQLVEMVKENPGKVFFASSGNGTMSHLAGELFGYTIGSRMTHVPYKGSSQAVTDLLSGSVPVMFAPASTVLPHVKSGRLKALATTGVERSRIAPELPTIAEQGLPDYDTRIWFGVVAPALTPEAVIRRLADAVDRALDSQDVKDQLAVQGIEPFKGDAKRFSEHMQREMTRWAAVIKSRGISAD
jgi:tripartite-type tricarboxylate transporter receptor subunit TctC